MKRVGNEEVITVEQQLGMLVPKTDKSGVRGGFRREPVGTPIRRDAMVTEAHYGQYDPSPRHHRS
jgi:hypothetical protein